MLFLGSAMVSWAAQTPPAWLEGAAVDVAEERPLDLALLAKGLDQVTGDATGSPLFLRIGAYEEAARQSANVSQAVVDNASAQSWRRHVMNPRAPSDVDAITETVGLVFSDLTIYGPAGLSLDGLSYMTVNGEHLASMLRASYRIRDQVPGWHEALQVAEDALRLAGLDPEDALIGLKRNS